MDDVFLDPFVAYERFARQSEERNEVGFARRHKRFLLAEWKHSADLFSERGRDRAVSDLSRRGG
jgi:hypothetical protein